MAKIGLATSEKISFLPVFYLLKNYGMKVINIMIKLVFYLWVEAMVVLVYLSKLIFFCCFLAFGIFYLSISENDIDEYKHLSGGTFERETSSNRFHLLIELLNVNSENNRNVHLSIAASGHCEHLIRINCK